MLRKAMGSRWAIPFAGLLGFLENSVILIPLEPLFLPMMASRGRGAWKIAAGLLAGNLVGGAMIYLLALWAQDLFIEPLTQWIGGESAFEEASQRLRENGFLGIAAIGVTPVPFQIGAAAAGALGYPFPLFLLAVLISRAVRYFAEAFLVMAIGSRAQDWIEEHELEIFAAGMGVIALVGLWIAL